MTVIWGDELRVIGRAKKSGKSAAGQPTRYRMALVRRDVEFNSNLPSGCRVPMWCYSSDPSVTGPIEFIEANVDEKIEVTWFSELAGESLANLMSFGNRFGMEEDHMLTVPHNVVHHHGARVSPVSDGYPMSYFHPNEGVIYRYNNHQAAGTNWFHDHTMDVSRLNVYAGLFGGYVIRDPNESAVGLPVGGYERLLVLQDKSFNADFTKLHYEQDEQLARPEFVGDYPVVNNQVWPVMTTEPAVYRFRIVNGANARTFRLQLRVGTSATQAGKKKVPFRVVGSDGGFLAQPAKLSELTIAPGERYDIVVDFEDFAGQQLVVVNNADCPFPGDAALAATENCATIMRFDVGLTAGVHSLSALPTATPGYNDPLAKTMAIPARNAFAAIDAAVHQVPMTDIDVPLSGVTGVHRLRRFVLVEDDTKLMATNPAVKVPSVSVNGKMWDTNVAAPVTAGTTEVWEFINLTQDLHPMHLHLVQFQVMSRTPVTSSGDYATPVLTIKPGVEERGWKDTVRCGPQEATRILVHFDGGVGEYMYHCHILEHEDMGMMYTFEVAQ